MSTEIKNDRDIDLKAIITDHTQSCEESDVIGSNWASNLLNTDSGKNIPVLPNDNITTSIEDKYDGSGLIVDMSEKPKDLHQERSLSLGINPDSLHNLDEYMKEFDEDINVAKENAENIIASQKNDDDKNDSDNEEEFNEAYDEAIVIIDKTGLGIVNFTDEERDKLERAKTIRLEEVENISLQTITIKKKKNKDVEKFIKQHRSIYTTPIVPVASGYTAQMRGCSTYEILALLNDSGNAVIDTETKWSLIHSKLENPSIGEMNYNDFLRNSAALDYNMFIYGILCSTYPDDDTIPLKCEKCGRDFIHKYSIKSLIRAEKMSERLKLEVADIVDASFSETMAKAQHKNSLMMKIKRFKLPVTGFVVETYVQSVYDYLRKSIKELSENKDNKYNQAAVLSSTVNRILIPAADNGNEYDNFDNAVDITKIIYSLGDTDLLVLSKQAEVLMDGLSFEFGLMNITCPNPVCGHYTSSIDMPLEELLFRKYQQALTTKIE